jgi:methylthioribose-1-phosphate isomerase
MSYSLMWDERGVHAIDQRALPQRLTWLELSSVDDVVEAIDCLAIRGAPALGIAGAMGVALSARNNSSVAGIDHETVLTDAKRLAAVRPTAVNLARGVQRAIQRLSDGAQAVADEAVAMLAEDERVNRAAARRAADLIVGCCPARPLRILTHCNTGRLATAAWGTALGAIADLAERGLVESVLVGETRPLLQGARLTAWELDELQIAHEVCVDSAAAAAMATGRVDCVVVGADRVAANGDVANKIGTYGLAVCAAHHDIPFVVVCPEATFDESVASGAGIVIECRAADEVRRLGNAEIAPAGTPVYNPAFDVTPTALVTAVVTECRVFQQSPETLADGYAYRKLLDAAVRSLVRLS